MQKIKARLYPDCSCCGERLEKKNELLPGLLQCPKCKNEHYVDITYDQKVMSLLSSADILKNSRQFNEAYDAYEAIAKDHPALSEAHFGMFLCSYGITYTMTDGIERYMPQIHQYSEDQPTENRHYLKTVEVTRDKYRKKHFLDEGAVIDQIWKDSKPSLKKAEKTKVKKVIPVEMAAPEVLAESPLIQRRGTRIPEGYKLNPILENKIKNAEVIYLKVGKFNRANKLFEEVLEVDPCARRAIWGKILCRLQVSDLELLGFNTKMSTIFPLFEELMGCLSKADENIYLKDFEAYLFRKLNSVNIFDEELYEYIVEWKKKGEQKTLANQLYANIKKLLEEDKKTEISWLHPALAQATKFDHIEDQKLYVSKYIEIAEDLNLLELYKDALKLAETVLLVDAKNKDALLIQLCATYKVPRLSHLHTVLKDMKQIKVFEELVDSGYKKLDLYEELKLAAIELISQKNFKQGIPFIDLYIEKLPEKEEEALADALLEFSNELIYNEKFKEAETYVISLVEKRPLLPAAHWNKLRLKLKANTNFDVLMYSKKDLMEYSDFAKAINSTSNPEDYIKFYELHDHLRQPVAESRKFKKMARKHYDELEEQCGNADIHTFITEIVTYMKKQIDILVKDEQARITNLFMRSIIVIILLSFAFMTSNLRSFFDYNLSNNGTHVAWYFWVFLQDLSGYIVVGTFVLLFIIESLIEGRGFLKGLLRGFGLGLAFAALGLIAGAGLPWALNNYLGATLYSVSPLILSGGLFGVVLIASIFIIRAFHKKLMEVATNKKTTRASWINLIILIILILAGFVGTYFIG